MEQKTKFIIIGLVGILVISFFMSFQIYNSKRTVEQEKDILKKENISLAAKINETNLQNQRLKDKVNALDRDLQTVAQEKEEVQKKYELVNKEREELTEQIKIIKAEAEKAQASVAEALPQTEDATGLLKAKKGLEAQLETIRNELKAAQIKNEDLKTNKTALDLEISSLTQETQDLKRQIEYNQKVVDGLSQDLAREKDDKFKIQNSLKAIRDENGLLKRRLKTLTNRKFNLDKKLFEAQKENATLADKIAGMDKLLKELGTQGPAAGLEEKKEKKEAVELAPIIVRPKTTENVLAQTPPFTGTVLSVNKENNFVVIDLGLDSGVKAGQVFRVYRQDRNIATIEVIQPRRAISACDIKKETIAIAVGDTVR